MDHRTLIDFLGVIEKLKCNTRHSWTSSGRRESVAEHSWRLSVMALLCADEYPHLDMNKVLKMCLVHDWGEAVTGDIPSFWKTEEHEAEEETAIRSLLSRLPEKQEQEFLALFEEMNRLETEEAKLYKALDNIEAVISHNEADLSTWLPREFDEMLIYGESAAECTEWTRQLRATLREDSLEKIQKAGK